MSEPLSAGRITEAPNILDISYLTNRHGHPFAVFAETDQRPGLGALLVGSSGVLAMSVNPHTPTAHVPTDCVAQFCNTWNNSYRWPTASIGTRPNGTRRLDIRANTVLLGEIDDHQLAATIRVQLDGAKAFTQRLGELTRNIHWTLDDTVLNELLTHTGAS